MSPHPDPLTEVLEVFPLTIPFAGRIDLAAPWGLSVPEGLGAVCSVRNTPCLLKAGGKKTAALVGHGDVIVLSPAWGQELRDAPTSPVVPVEELTNRARGKRRPVLSFGAGGAAATLLGGIFRFEGAKAHPLHSTLPPVVHLSGQQAAGLDEVFRAIERELSASQPGCRGIINRLVEILFIEAVRTLLVETGGTCEGSIRGMLHPEIAAALALVHRHPEKPWTVAMLADRVAMSRSAFSATFVKVLGKPPLQYVRERRMQLACRLLRDPSLGLRDIASRIGYDSVSAFTTAFKRYSGASPGDYRHREVLDEMT